MNHIGGFFYSFLLILLGITACLRSQPSRSAEPGVKGALRRLGPGLGDIGVVIGSLSLVVTAVVMIKFKVPPVSLVMLIINDLLLIALGLILSYDPLRPESTPRDTAFSRALQRARDRFAVTQPILGVAAIALGILHFFI